ncbi:MAG: NAD(+) diphosphatase [Pseudomonadota bacterium]|nr:NAD(+) diphosphatase [Pseudomonadota bacterium]
MKSLNIFAGAFVDRSGHRRNDPNWIRDMLGSPEARFAPVWRNRCLIDGNPPRAALLRHAKVDLLLARDESIFLGIFDDKPAFAFEVDSPVPPLEHDGEFHDLRYLGTILPVDQANLLAHAIALINWHRLQKHCGTCGALTIAESGGNARRCTSDSCANPLFPRVDPAIIVLVSHGENCLLGRQASWPEKRYSTIAGFVEPGESLEDAVHREVKEETNIDVGDVHYHSSQPWPFPSSLMLGFTADASSREIRLNDGELEDARWFTRKELRSGFPKLPFQLSLARRLIDGWLEMS